MKLSIIIPYHNEGEKFIRETVSQISRTIDFRDYEVIIVDDGSTMPLKDAAGARIIRHDENTGVGAAFDTGVKHATSENLMLMGADIRFAKNRWATMLLDEIENNPEAFTCTTCVGLNESDMDFERRRLVSWYNGATLIIFHDRKSNPKKAESFRGILEAKWLPRIENRNVMSYQVPCILGAAYGVKKSWYQYCDGFAGHRMWGTLEPYISLKSWMFGGSCRVAPRIETGHIFKSKGTHGTKQHYLLYNKMMVARMLFPDHERLTNFLGGNPVAKKARQMCAENMRFIVKKQAEYAKKTVVPVKDFLMSNQIDYRIN